MHNPHGTIKNILVRTLFLTLSLSLSLSLSQGWTAENKAGSLYVYVTYGHVCGRENKLTIVNPHGVHARLSISTTALVLGSAAAFTTAMVARRVVRRVLEKNMFVRLFPFFDGRQKMGV
jgi:hypothetical protein